MAARTCSADFMETSKRFLWFFGCALMYTLFLRKQQFGGEQMRITRLAQFSVGGFVALLIGVSPAFASLSSYASYADWSGVVSGITAVTIPDPGSAGYIYFGNGNASV